MLGSGQDVILWPTLFVNGLECGVAIFVVWKWFECPFGWGFLYGSGLKEPAGGDWARKLSLFGETMTWVEEKTSLGTSRGRLLDLERDLRPGSTLGTWRYCVLGIVATNIGAAARG